MLDKNNRDFKKNDKDEFEERLDFFVGSSGRKFEILTQKVSKTAMSKDLQMIDKIKSRGDLLLAKNDIGYRVLSDVRELANLINEETIHEIVIEKVFGKSIERVKLLSEDGGFNQKTVNKIEGKEYNQIKYSRYVIKDISKKIVTENFYRTKNHNSLHSLGRNFENYLKEGINSFGVYSLASQENSIETILGLLTYFNYYQQKGLVIILEQELLSSLKKLFPYFQSQDESNNLDLDIPCFSYLDNEILTYEDIYIQATESNASLKEYSKLISLKSDVLFAQIPEIQKIKKNKQLFFPILDSVNNISLITNQINSSVSKLNNAKKFFELYNLHINGLIINKGML